MWKKTRTHVSLMDQHQSNTKHNSILENNDSIGDNGQTVSKKRTNGETNNLSDNEDSIENNTNQQNKNNQNQDNYDEDAEENEEDEDENFNVRNFKRVCSKSKIKSEKY